MIDISFDMETSDPDDVFTLCLLAHHPRVNLVSVTVTPGSRHQIGVVKHILNLLGKDVSIGSFNINHPKECVSSFHYKWLGDIPPFQGQVDSGAKVLSEALAKYSNLTILCGGPLKNIGALIREFDPIIPRIVVQGGFAGSNIVPEELILEKFKGKQYCPTFNLNGDPKSAQFLLSNPKAESRIFVSKNVCHGVIYNQKFHQEMKQYVGCNSGFDLMFAGMEKYLQDHEQKAFHDPLAACVAIDQTVCPLVSVNLHRRNGEWGSVVNEFPNALISISVDFDKFKKTIIS